MLRFPLMGYRKGCEFTVCFCDSQLHGEGACERPAHYEIAIGRVHPTDLTCAVRNAEMANRECYAESPDGLSCSTEVWTQPSRTSGYEWPDYTTADLVRH